MAKTSMVERDKRRAAISKKYWQLRAKLKATVINIHLSDEERWQAQEKLQTLPRDANPVRGRNRCRQCGRSRAYNRLTGLCRLHMRAAVMNGLIPGMHKASW